MRLYPSIFVAASTLLSSRSTGFNTTGTPLATRSTGFNTTDTPLATFRHSADVPSVSSSNNDITIKRPLEATEMTKDEDRMGKLDKIVASLEDLVLPIITPPKSAVKTFVKKQEHAPRTQADNFASEAINTDSISVVSLPASDSARSTPLREPLPSRYTAMDHVSALELTFASGGAETSTAAASRRTFEQSSTFTRTQGESIAIVRYKKFESGKITNEQLDKITLADQLITGDYRKRMMKVFRLSVSLRRGKDHQWKLYRHLCDYFGDNVLSSVLRDVEKTDMIPERDLEMLKKARLQYWLEIGKGPRDVLRTMTAFENEDEKYQNIVLNAMDLKDFIKLKNGGVQNDKKLLETFIEVYEEKKFADIVSKAQAKRVKSIASVILRWYFPYLKEKEQSLPKFFQTLEMENEGVKMITGPKFKLLAAYATFLNRKNVEEDVVRVYIDSLSSPEFGALLAQASKVQGSRHRAKYIAQCYFKFLKEEDIAEVLRKLREDHPKEAETFEKMWNNYRDKGFQKYLDNPFKVPYDE
ncbi:hypothetical protein PsorP6_003041 [Peronosclerospora sorghi]|uniref:Uncharacterized protein n=1 Tax=Peronosclerospora sorghi TaxID=230839 RepID=A0ACC0VSV5_9STRA|nr:hypothetical protein PsorP6_003041 [Peronosclerospora sorghi]